MTAFLVLLLAYTISQFDRGFLAMVAPDLGPDLGLSPSDLALLSAGWFLAFAAGQVPTGLLLDRIGPRRTVAGFLVLAALGAACLGWAQGFIGAAAAMALIGLGCAPALMGGLYLFGRVYPPERFAMLSSLMIGFGTAGDLLGSTPLALASHALGWRAILFGLAAVTLAAAGLVLWLIEDPPRLADPPQVSVWQGFADVARMRALWPILPVVFVSYAVVIATRSLWVGAYLGGVHGLDALQRGNGTLAMSAAMAAGADHVIVALDCPQTPSWRKTRYSDYKANRSRDTGPWLLAAHAARGPVSSLQLVPQVMLASGGVCQRRPNEPGAAEQVIDLRRPLHHRFLVLDVETLIAPVLERAEAHPGEIRHGLLGALLLLFGHGNLV